MGRKRLAQLHGIAVSYEPSPGQTVHIGDDTVVAVLAALGVDASTPQAVRAALDAFPDGPGRPGGALLPRTVVARPDRPPDLADLPEGTGLRVETEDGQVLEGPARDAGARSPWAPGRLPLGIHTLHAHAPDGRAARARLIVAPDRVPAPPGRSHGLMVQLYSLLSRRSWGMGDLGRPRRPRRLVRARPRHRLRPAQPAARRRPRPADRPLALPPLLPPLPRPRPPADRAHPRVRPPAGRGPVTRRRPGRPRRRRCAPTSSTGAR